jgi:hypothetical protein
MNPALRGRLDGGASPSDDEAESDFGRVWATGPVTLPVFWADLRVVSSWSQSPKTSPQTERKDVSRETSSLSIRREIRQVRNDYARNAASFNLRLTRPRWESARPPFGQGVAAG